jgi:hypothetical protein
MTINDARIDDKIVPLGLVEGNPMQALILKVCDAMVGRHADNVEEEERYILEA